MDEIVGRWQARTMLFQEQEMPIDKSKGKLYRFNEDGSVWFGYFVNGEWKTEKESWEWLFVRRGIYQITEKGKPIYNLSFDETKIVLKDTGNILTHYLERL